MIQVEQLSKYYGARAAIRDLSFRIDAGEVVGFLGLNGAGKTTTLRILGCVLLPTSGTVRLDGEDLLTAPRQLRARIGFLPETPPLYEEMSVGEYLAFVAGLRSVDPARIPARVTETEERTGLADLDDERISTLSHGYRQRVGVAQALVHGPDVLLLDEPANGLDPVQNVEMRSLIRSLRGDHTVLDRVRVGQRLGPQRRRQVGHHSTVLSHLEQRRRSIEDGLVVHGEQPAKR